MAAVLNVVTPDYFNTMSIPLKQGRWFSDSDTEQAARVAVINDTAAKKFFADSDPLGQQLFVSGQGEQPYRVVGVVGSSRQFDITSPPSPEIFTNYQQSTMSYMYVLARTAGDPSALVPAIRRAVAEIDPEQPVGHRTLDQQLENAITEPRFYTLLMGLFAGLALLLAAIGVYGAMAYAVSQRTREIGVRMALGAQRSTVMRLFLRDGLKLAILGVVVGLALAFAATHAMASLLFNVKPTDALAFGSAALLLCLAVFLANLIPARRATRVDPLLALRE
jgi:putative ABC transport system permease protein